jgi:hypothetical protein
MLQRRSVSYSTDMFQWRERVIINIISLLYHSFWFLWPLANHCFVNSAQHPFEENISTANIQERQKWFYAVKSSTSNRGRFSLEVCNSVKFYAKEFWEHLGDNKEIIRSITEEANVAVTPEKRATLSSVDYQISEDPHDRDRVSSICLAHSLHYYLSKFVIFLTT